MTRLTLIAACFLGIFWFPFAGRPAAAESGTPVRLAHDPALSPDGKTIVFSWRGDIWSVAAAGGAARQLTTDPGRDRQPLYSPDGKQLALVSNRSGSDQIYLMAAEGGPLTQLTFHTEGYVLEDWYPTGEHLLARGNRDHFWRDAQRLMRLSAKPRPAETVLFDGFASDGRLSPDGKRLLFTREGAPWWRKGYRGSQAQQIWLYEFDSQEFTKLLAEQTECRHPLWAPDGKSFYYVSGRSGSFNLWKRELESDKDEQLTWFEDDSVVFPAISRDGSTIVFRHLADLYRLDVNDEGAPVRLDIRFAGDLTPEPIERRVVKKADSASFTSDGLEVAFVAGGDVWVMDTVFREPVQVTDTPEEERDVVFSADRKSIYFVSDRGGQSDIWRAQRKDASTSWWRSSQFNLERLTNDAETESDLQTSPDGKRLSYIRGRGDICIISNDGKDFQRVVASWSRPEYDWSPDGKWLVYSSSDADFNEDIFVTRIDGSTKPFNLSRMPRNEGNPRWSPDGLAIAFTGERFGGGVDVYFVYLDAEKSEESARDRKLEQSIKKIRDARGGDHGSDDGGKKTAAAGKKGSGEKKKKGAGLSIDFDDIHDRIERVALGARFAGGLFWSHDSKRLAFSALLGGARGTYTISPPDSLKPARLIGKTGSGARWLARGNQIVWLADGTPGSVSSSGKDASYAFVARQAIDRPAYHETAFMQCWRTMRDYYYDGNLNNRDWDEVYRKYASLAREALDERDLAEVVHLMLGELNGSHLGFRPGPVRGGDRDTWTETTAHLGLRFDAEHRGPGLKVRDVLRDGPCDRERTRVLAGEIVMRIDGERVDGAMDLTKVLNGPLERDVKLTVRGTDDEERVVTIRPINFTTARELLYEMWVRDNRQRVDKLSDNRLGYLHIARMRQPNFEQFEQDLFAVAADKEGLVIDVRYNPGGSITDHLLTILTTPMHAITVARGGEAGYPHDRRVYASWTKPIIVLCNQGSFSNAEIFSHAVKTLKRGKVVGVPTAGGVISTGARSIMDLGSLRLPYRGWYVRGTGDDMELNGAVPDVVIWPRPTELPQGIDRQLEKAVELLRADVQEAKKRPDPRLRKASERKYEDG